MSKIREQLVDRMIRLYGFESPIAIDFCRLCEEWPNTEAYDNALAILVKCNEETPLYFEEEQLTSLDSGARSSKNKY